MQIEIDAMQCDLELPLDRPLFNPPIRLALQDTALEIGAADTAPDALYAQQVVDRTRLADHIRNTLNQHGVATLRDLTHLQPLTHGLAELMTYLDLGSSRFEMDVLDFIKDSVIWQQQEAGQDVERHATMQRIHFREKSV